MAETIDWPQLEPLQVEGRDWLTFRRRACLWDEPGVGKTPQAVAALDELRRWGLANRALVVAPSSVTYNWRNELERFTEGGIRPEQVFVVDSLKAMKKAPLANPDFQVVVISYVLLAKAETFLPLRAWRPHLCIIDELQFFKSPTALRTLALYGAGRIPGLVQASDRTWLLSGTPMKNHYGELYTMLQAVWPERVVDAPDYDTFLAQHCRIAHGKHGSFPVANLNPARSRALLNGIYLRRTQKDRGANGLPPVRFVEHVLPEPSPKARAELESSLPPRVQRLFEGDDPPADALAALAKSNEFSVFRRLAARLKIEHAIEWIKLQTQGDEPIVIIGHHTEPLDEIGKAFKRQGSGVIRGGTSAKKRADLTAQFQRRELSVLCVQITAAVGMTLTAADRLAFLEMSPTPSDNEQCYKRIHRHTQTRPCTVTCLTLPRTPDRQVMGTLRRKLSMIGEILPS